MEEILELMSQYISEDFKDSVDVIYSFSAVDYFEKLYENILKKITTIAS